jgi:predicted metal-dependent peptidase
MISIRSSADMAETLSSLLDPDLRRLLTERRDQLLDYDGYDLGDLVHIIVVQQHADTLAAVEAEAGVPLATNLVDGGQLGEPDFEPCFEYVERHGGLYEAVLVLSDDGFGLVLIVPDRIDTDPDLLALLRRQL